MSNLYPPASPSDEPFESRSDAEAGPLSDEARLRSPNPTPLFDSVAPRYAAACSNVYDAQRWFVVAHGCREAAGLGSERHCEG